MSGEIRTTTYLNCLYPGSLVPEDSSLEVDHRDALKAAREVDADVFAFSFHDVVSTFIEVDGKPVELRSRAIRKSPLYYIDAEELTADDVEALPGDHSILLFNMRGNEWDTVIRCRSGNFRPKAPGDIVISTRDDAASPTA